MRVLSVLALVLLVGVASASTRHVLHTRSSAPRGWTAVGPAKDTDRVTFMIAIKQQNLDQLDQIFWEVSDPESPKWGQFLSSDEIMDIIRPKQEDHDSVMKWLMMNKITEIKSFGDAIEATTTVAIASELFKTEFHSFQHSETQIFISRAFGEYSVPVHFAQTIEMVTGLSGFPVPHLKTNREGAATNYGVVPQTADLLYNMPTGHKSENTSQGVIEFEGQNYSPSELSTFATDVNVPIKALTSAHIVGSNDASSPQVEATLDIQYIAGVNPGADNWFWLEPGQNWLYRFAVHFFSTKDVPLVNSISYGWSESDQCTISGGECQTLGVNSEGFVTRTNTEFQKIGARGVTLMSASGDSGANGRTDGSCTQAKLFPPFPAASPYITAVGATELVDAKTSLPNPPPICAKSGYPCASDGTEQAVSYAISNFASGGGFSNYVPTPAYQKDAVAAYLKSGVALPPSGYFNSSNRGFPDIAALGHNFLIYTGGSIQAVGGTSAASPTAAGVMALLNSVKQSKTGTPLGFLNPFLYKAAAKDAKSFNDVVTGDNICTEDGCSSSCKGFKCAAGWDPVTGLGTPNYVRLLSQLEAFIDARQQE